MRRYIYFLLLFTPFLQVSAQKDSAKSDLNSILREHADDVECIAFSPDGKFVATGGWDRTIRVFSIDSTIDWYGSLYGHDAAVTTLAFSRDSKKIVSGGNDFNTIIWELDSEGYFNQKQSFRFGTMAVTSVVYGLSLKTIFSAGVDGKIISYDIDKKIERKIDNKQAVNCIAVSNDQRNIYCADNELALKQYDIRGTVTRTFEGHLDAINSVAVAINNKFIVTGSSDKTAKIWDVQSGKLLFTLEGHEWKVTSVAISLDCKYIVTGSTDGSVKLWNAENGTIIKSFSGIGNQVVNVTINNSNKLIGSAIHLESTFEEGFGEVIWNSGIEPPKKVIRTAPGARRPAPGQTPGQIVPGAKPTAPPADPSKKVIKKTDEVEISIQDNKKK
jgi:WD40 repeat protein